MAEERGGPTAWPTSRPASCVADFKARQLRGRRARPIGLMEVLGKVVMSWLDKQVTQVWRRHKVLSAYQFGFQRHRGVCEAVRMVFDLILLVKADGQVVWACLSDVKAAFPNVPGFAWNRACARVRLPSWIRGCFNFKSSQQSARLHILVRRASDWCHPGRGRLAV